MKKSMNGGFTLIELMVVVGVIAILASIAYPAYTSAILKGKRAEARTALAELMQQQERYLTQTNCYLGFTTAPGGLATASAPSPITACGGITAAAVPFKVFSGDSLAKASYLLSADACPVTVGAGTLSIADCVRVIATPVVVGSDPEANALRMMSTGTKDCSGTNQTVCWK